MKCGIIFSKFSRHSKNDRRIYYSSKIPFQKNGIFQSVIWPIAKAKLFIEHVFNRLIEMIWQELLGDKTEYGQIANLVAVFIFAIFSILIYHFQEYLDFAFIALLSIWLIDYRLAKLAYKNGKNGKVVERIHLIGSKTGRFSYKKTSPDGQSEKIDFNADETKQLTVTHFPCKGGAFRETMGHSWRINIIFHDGFNLLLDDLDEVINALKKAKQLADYFKIPVRLSNSEGISPFVSTTDQDLNHLRFKKKEIFSKGIISLKKFEDCIQVYSKWTWVSFWKFLKTVVKETGFFLFLLILAGVMIRFGMLLSFHIGPYFGIKPPHLILNISFQGVLNIFRPQWDWMDALAYTIALGIMILGCWKYSRKTLIEINPQKSTFYLNGMQFAELKTSNIENPIFIKEPYPCVLIMEKNQTNAVEVTNLQNTDEFRGMMFGIEEALGNFR
jgi:hypothetical protein